jgi:hypothetical protein
VSTRVCLASASLSAKAGTQAAAHTFTKNVVGKYCSRIMKMKGHRFAASSKDCALMDASGKNLPPTTTA